MIYERTLELSHKLCWNSEDLGISRVHIHDDRTFKSRSALEKFCEERGEAIPEPRYFFDWLDPIKKYTGVARQHYLRDEHWCNREQVMNILLDTAMQAYREDSRKLLCSMTGADFQNSELVKFDIRNQARQYTGDPDSTFVDLESGNIALVEIKIGSSTKYSLDQSVKYETMSALLRCDEFFPSFRVHKVLLGPSPSFSQNTFKAGLLRPSSNSEGRISFAYDAASLAALKPKGHAEISTLVAARMQKLARGNMTIPKQGGEDGVWFFSWRGVERLCPPGLLRRNITALMRYLAPGTPA